MKEALSTSPATPGCLPLCLLPPSPWALLGFCSPHLRLLAPSFSFLLSSLRWIESLPAHSPLLLVWSEFPHCTSDCRSPSRQPQVLYLLSGPVSILYYPLGVPRLPQQAFPPPLPRQLLSVSTIVGSTPSSSAGPHSDFLSTPGMCFAHEQLSYLHPRIPVCRPRPVSLLPPRRKKLLHPPSIPQSRAMFPGTDM